MVSDLEVHPTLEVDPKPGFWDLLLGWGVYGKRTEEVMAKSR